MTNEISQESFETDWVVDQNQTKQAYLKLKERLENYPDVEIDFKPRPGISFSLRGKHRNQANRPLFVMIDVIDDEPDSRWLSVCFFGEMITDPEEKGDLVPGGLLGEDGYCFDLDQWDEEEFKYIEDRVKEAFQTAAGE
jgi:hypothetical protein